MSSHEQDAFMQHIANKLGRDRVMTKPEHPFRGAPSFWQNHQLEEEVRVELFISNWTNVGGHAESFATMGDVASFIIATAEQLSVKHIIHHDLEALHQLALPKQLPNAEVTIWDGECEGLITRAAHADLGIVVADYAVAETGSVVLQSAAHKGRSVSLLPTALIIIVRRDVLLTTMGEVMRELEQLGAGQMPAGIHFVSGPSRSADIENDLTIGVHGPGIVYALIVDH